MLHELIPSEWYGMSFGSGTLKGLQNETLSDLDLLVREAIQNSSDASIPVTKEKSIIVNFNTGKFIPRQLNGNFPSLEYYLNALYPGASANYLEIRDRKTTGLTGSIRLEDVADHSGDEYERGNFWKLIFDTGKEQKTEGAGGSWGYGKSVYYRVGIGLVMFYSRINEKGEFKDRLIFSLVENEDSGDSLLSRIKPDSIGRAWWGEAYPNGDAKKILPVTDSAKVKKFLDIFGIKPFRACEAGTSIVIPYIDGEKLLKGTIKDETELTDEEKAVRSWNKSLEEYLKFAIQKWYAPKIDNRNLEDYGNKWLNVRVNDEAVCYEADNIRPFFRLVQELFTTAVARNSKREYSSEEYPTIEVVDVRSRAINGQAAGSLAYCKISLSELNTDGSVTTPFTYIGTKKEEGERNNPIMLCARDLGMVLNYEVHSIPQKVMSDASEDEFFISFFVPNSDAEIRNKEDEDGQALTLGKYLRSCEKSDHMSWEDKADASIVKNLRKYIEGIVDKEVIPSSRGTLEGASSRLSGILGRRLLPSLGYGKKAVSGGSSGGGGGGAFENNLKLATKARLESGLLYIDFNAEFRASRKDLQIRVFVQAENGMMDVASWEKNICGKPFPLRLTRISDCKVLAQTSGNISSFQQDCSLTTPVVENDYSTLSLIMSDNGNVSGFQLSNQITKAVVSGTMVIETDDRKCVCAVKDVRS